MTINELIKLNLKIYGVIDDRLYSVDDLLYYSQKYMLRFIDQTENKKNKQAKIDLIAALFWYIALLCRFHIDIEKELWKHYSFKCPRCLDIPCSCENIDTSKRKKTGRPSSRRPKNLTDWQQMIKKIYPVEEMPDISNKLIKCLDKLSFYFRNYIKKPNDKNFKELKYRTTDYFVLFFESFNLVNVDMEQQIMKMFENGCYVCHKTPCICNYSE